MTGACRTLVAAALLTLTALAAPRPAAADLYRWVDEHGGTHFTQGLSNVPERYRGSAEFLGSLPLRHDPPPPSEPPKPSGVTRIRFTPHASGMILVKARVNGKGPLTLILDTGADRTVISQRVLRRLGIDPRAGVPGRLMGVTGGTDVFIVQVDSIEVDAARVGPIHVVAHGGDLPDADGLLGRNFLNSFTVLIDAGAGVVTLTRR